MFNFVFKSRWYVQLVLALVAFAAAVFFYLDSQRFEASKAAARAAGMPAAVSLNDFDPARDVHPADEVHVTGWINPDYTYQLIEEHRRSSDTIRRMFVMFGPSDPVDARVARAVVLLEEADVDRFIEAVVAAPAGFVGDNPVFALNGFGRSYGTLDDMADEALVELGLTKAPGFRYLEIWPVGGREAGLAATPLTGLYIAGGVGGFGLLLLGIAIYKFRRRDLQPAVAAPVADVPAMPAPKAAATKRSLALHSWGFLGLAVAAGVISTWVGSWQLMALAGVMAVVHFAARVKVAMDRGVTAVAARLSGQTAAADPAPQDSGSAGERSQASARSVLAGSGRSGIGNSLAKIAAAVVVLAALPMLLDDKLLGGLLGGAGLPTLDVSSTEAETPAPVAADPSTDEAVVSPAAPALETSTAAQGALPADAPAAAPVVAPRAEDPLIPAAASLRPAHPEMAATPSPAPPPPAAAPEIAAVTPAAPPVVPEPAAAEPVAEATPAPEPVAVAAAEEAEPAPQAAPEAPVTEAKPEPAESASVGSFLAGLNLGALAASPMLASSAGAGLLAAAAFALMRGRQRQTPAVFAGRDPWERLAREVQSRA